LIPSYEINLYLLVTLRLGDGELGVLNTSLAEVHCCGDPGDVLDVTADL